MNQSKSYFRFAKVAIAAFLVGVAANSHSQPLLVPNNSFEMQPGNPQQFGVNINIDSWQKAGKPSYFPAAGSNGVFWVQTAGVFAAPAYGNQVGAQAGYILSYTHAGIFQDFDTRDWDDASPTHDFNILYEVGKSYKLTVGLYGKFLVEDESQLELSLYYRDGFNAIVPVASTTATFSTAIFSGSAPFNLVDYEVNVPTVQFGDDWAGQNIGIKIASLNGDGNGYWDLDNVRLEAVPEPASLSLLVLGAGGLWLVRKRSRLQF